MLKSKPWKPWKTWVLVLTILIATGWIVRSSEDLQGFVHRHKHDHAYEALYENNAGFLRYVARFRLALASIGNFTDKNEGSVVGLATVALFISTLLLWLATREADATNRISADAAKSAAKTAERALTDLEGPFLFPVIDSTNIVSLFSPLKRYDHPTSPHSPIRPTVWFTVKNYGRTVAFPQYIATEFFHGEPDDRHINHLTADAPDLVVAPEEASQRLERVMLNEITRDDYRAIMDGGHKIWLRGRIIYTDVFGSRYEQTFCLAWMKQTKTFKALPREKNMRRRIYGSGYGPDEGH